MSFGVVHALRVVHLIAAGFWVGVAIMNAFFLVPSIRAAGPAGGAVMRELVQVRRLPVYINGAAVIAVLSGFALYAWRSDGFQNSWLATRSSMVFGVGGVLALIAALLGLFVIGPYAARMSRLAARAQSAGGPPPTELQAEMQQVQTAMRRVSLAGLTLILLATLCMAVGRYV